MRTDERRLRLAAWLAEAKGDVRRWYRPHAKQREFHTAGKDARERLFLAGNRVGKTLAGACEVAFHLTGRYPDWWDGVRFERPVEAWAASVTREATRDILQETYLGKNGVIAKSLIAGMAMRSGIAGAVDVVRVRHVSGGNSTLGFKSYVTRAIALTAEQQAERDQLDAIMAESLAEIRKLSASDYAADEATQKVLDQWKVAQTELLGEQVGKRSKSEEEELARRGLGDSTAAQDVRRQRALDEQKAVQNISTQTDEMASQIRNEKLGLQQSLYNLAASQNDVTAARTAQAATRAQSTALALNAQRQASIMDYYSTRTGGGAFGDSFSSALGSSLGKAAVGGSTGGLGGMLGSLFMRG